MKNNGTRTGLPANHKKHFDRGKLREEQIRQLYSQVRPGVFGGIAAASILTVALWNVAPHSILIAWFLFLILVQIVRLVLASAFDRSAPTGNATILWGRRLAFTSSAAAVTWGLSAILLFPEHSLSHQFLICAFLVGVAAFFAVSNAPRPESCVPAILLVLTPLAGRYIYEGGEVPFTIGIVVIVFAAALLGIARTSYKLVSESILLRFQNSHLIASLETARDGLQIRIDERAAELLDANTQLKAEIAERTRTEEALRIEKERFQSLSDHAPFGMVRVGSDGTFQYINPAFIKMFGYDAEEVPDGRQWFRLAFPDAEYRRQAIAAWIEDMQKTQPGEVRPRIFTVNCKDGSQKVIHFRPVKLGTGEDMMICEDITERKRAEVLLQESEIKHRELYEKIRDGVAAVSADGRIVDSNVAFQQMLGYSTDELYELAYEEVTPARWHSLEAKIFNEQVLTRGYSDVYEKECIHKDGAVFPVEIRTYLKLDEKGNYEGVWAFVRDITERKRAEEDLLESEQKYRGLFNDSRDAIFVTSRDGELLDCNQSFIEIFGFEGQEMKGMNVRSLYVDPGARQRFQEAVERKGYVKDYPLKLRKKDGSEMECILTASVRTAGDGTVYGYYGLIRDVTEQKRSEEALRFEREQLLSIFESFNETVYVSDPYTYEVLYMNKFGKEFLGTDPVGKICYKEFQGLDQPCDFCTNKLILERKGEPYRWEHYNPVVKRDYALVDRIIRWPDGRDVRFELTIDITDRKLAEEKLRKSEEKYRTIIETIADGYHEVDLPGNLTLFNDSLCEINGYPRQELMGMNYRQLMDEHNAKQVFEAYNRVFTTGNVDKGFQFELTRKDGSKRQASVSISPIRDADGNPCGFRGIIRDITEKVQLEERLRQAGKMEAIALLPGGVAHDFNNILTAIIGYSDVLLQQIPAEAPYRDKVIQISRAGARAASLTRQLLAFSRKQMLDVTVLDINSLISDLESMLRRVIGEDIELTTAFDPHLEKVNADQSQVEQILLNLAVNARDAMPAGGRLTMETANVFLDEEYARRHADVKAGTYVMFAVSDTGHGMTPDVLSRAFDPFFTTKGTGKGTGLGLSTVYGIVKQHQGHISGYSEPGRGTTFKVYLPRADEPIMRAMKAPAAKVGLRGKETILVVEDDEILLNLATEVLEMLGYSVLKASGSDEALRIGGQHQGHIHLLLTDVVLPQMDGKTLFTRLSPAFPEMKVLYMSGYAENAIVHHGVLEPGVNFLQKPFSVEGLAKKVREVLEQA